MPPPCTTIAAVTASNVPFARHPIANRKASDFVADLDNLTAVFMPYCHWHRNRFLRPGIPFIDMHVGTADSGLANTNAHVVGAERRDWNVLQFDAGAGVMFD
jgi:hypothetical protein